MSTKFPTVWSSSHHNNGHAPRETFPRDPSCLTSPSSLTRRHCQHTSRRNTTLSTRVRVLNNQYQALAKIGYGVTSTVWLAKDLTQHINDHERELHICTHMNSKETNHPGRNFIRQLLDHFYIQALMVVTSVLFMNISNGCRYYCQVVSRAGNGP
ncbi:kinase-like domain-containing protein [Penicillium rubens]|uniref:kinase-like domain-containing protein n=1 Tax=Penicillium rubens TaxID=1108849 RepID=UPI002A5AB8B1|nr:kinase-like domain-containing protein [Penicillium rubens]KAJ5838894.1 kinase-like domain-containing protein [Penicillium rubens]KAJ5866944.1 kinase-like domain-containing protein [Penicillium rubens]